MKLRRVVLLLACVTAACASSKHPASEPKHEEVSTAGTSERAYADTPAAVPQPSAAASQDTLQRTDFQAQFGEQLAEIERLDCGNACRALGSLERSADNICGITGAQSATCQDVQKKREAAKGRVRDRCGACP